jgi:hypothetical protein
MNLRLAQIAIIVFGVFFISLNSFEQAWAQDSTFAQDLIESTFLSEDSKIFPFLLFVIGIAIYSLFVWSFYHFISKRDFLPKFFYPTSVGDMVKPKLLALSGAAYFIVLAFFVFLISKDMPFEVALFVSMSIIAVVRILSYYREAAASEIAKMIPYAILSFLLTSAAVYADPNFFTEKQLNSIPVKFMENLGGILSAMVVVTVFEFGFRIAFIIKRRFLPAPEKILEEQLETEVKAITKAHFQKMENKEKELEKRLDELKKRLDESSPSS